MFINSRLDHLYVEDQSKVADIVNGSSNIEHTYDSDIKIIFTTDFNVTYRGFKLECKLENCHCT